MKLLIYYEKEIDTELDLEGIYSEIVNETERLLNLLHTEDLEVNITITGNDEIQEINRETRSIDAPTDVLSFPFFEFEKEGEILASFDNETILGDIIISFDRACEQAEEYGHSLKRELSFLFTHGLLHILGFDHIEESDRLRMEEMQSTILDNLKIGR